MAPMHYLAAMAGWAPPPPPTTRSFPTPSGANTLALGVALSRGGATPMAGSKILCADEEAAAGGLQSKEMLSAEMLSAMNEMLSEEKRESGGSKWPAKLHRKRQRNRNRRKALMSKGGGTHLVFHSLSLPVRTLLKIARSKCIEALTANFIAPEHA